jgi:hypothetical protein
MKAALFLYDYTTEAAKPWAAVGYMCYCVDTQHPPGYTIGGNNIILVGADVLKWFPPKMDWVFGMAFPPCTDLAVSGARHFEKKRLANPNYRKEAMDLVHRARGIFKVLKIPYCIENPVSVISSEWRKPDYIFHPHQYGGYIKFEDSAHPMWPNIIPPVDAYTKKTCLWTGGGFTMPTMKNVTPFPGGFHGWTSLGGKSLRTKNIRSATPRGFAIACCETHKR